MALQSSAATTSHQPQTFGGKEQRPDGLEPFHFEKTVNSWDENLFSYYRPFRRGRRNDAVQTAEAPLMFTARRGCISHFRRRDGSPD